MGTHGTCPPSEGNSQFRMINVEEKAATRRRAIAEGRFVCAPETLRMIAERKLPKGDVLALAEVAGIQGAKKTSEILPLCHPLNMDSVRVYCTVEENGVRVICEAIATAKTGVEMEALTGVNAALLCLYDLTKGVDPVLSISDVHLKIKEGGKSGVWVNPMFGATLPSAAADEETPAYKNVKFGVLTVSDRCSQGKAEDTSGPHIKSHFENEGAQFVAHELVPDEISRVQSSITNLFERGAQVVVSTGGTGIGPRDVTPDAIQKMGGRVIDGIGELLRREGAFNTEMSWLSRAQGFQFGEKIVVTLPGSLRAVTEGLETIRKILPHAIAMAKGGRH